MRKGTNKNDLNWIKSSLCELPKDREFVYLSGKECLENVIVDYSPQFNDEDSGGPDAFVMFKDENKMFGFEHFEVSTGELIKNDGSGYKTKAIQSQNLREVVEEDFVNIKKLVGFYRNGKMCYVNETQLGSKYLRELHPDTKMSLNISLSETLFDKSLEIIVPKRSVRISLDNAILSLRYSLEKHFSNHECYLKNLNNKCKEMFGYSDGIDTTMVYFVDMNYCVIPTEPIYSTSRSKLMTRYNYLSLPFGLSKVLKPNIEVIKKIFSVGKVKLAFSIPIVNFLSTHGEGETPSEVRCIEISVFSSLEEIEELINIDHIENCFGERLHEEDFSVESDLQKHLMMRVNKGGGEVEIERVTKSIPDGFLFTRDEEIPRHASREETVNNS